MSKCTRCALENGVKNLDRIAEKCIWLRAGTRCPDYDERPDMNSIVCEKIPQNGTKILRRQMRLLAEKSRFESSSQLAGASEAMLKIQKHLLIQPLIGFIGIQILLGIFVGLFIVVDDFWQRR